MSYFGRLARAIVNQSDSLKDAENWLVKVIANAVNSAAGVYVSPDRALRIAAAYACIKILSETIASLPLQFYKKRKSGGRDLDNAHYLYNLVTFEPNDFQTSFEWIENFVAQLKMRGNAYHRIVRYANKITSLFPYVPDKVEIEQDNEKLYYKYTHPDGTSEDKIPAKKIWHLKELSISSSLNAKLTGKQTNEVPEGIIGISPIEAARETIGLSLASDEFAARFFSNNASVGLALRHPQKLSDNAKKFLKDSLAEFAKLENKFKSLILEEGLEVEKLGFSNNDAQLLESRNLSIEEIARIFRVPSILIGHPDKTMTYASAEQLFLNFAVHTIRPLCVRIERSMNRYLIRPEERNDHYFEFNIDALLRGDIKARTEAFAKGRQWGWWSADDIREKFNENPIPDNKGKTFLEPENMRPAGEYVPRGQRKGNK